LPNGKKQDVLRVERELLQLEQEELKRQRSNLAYREQKQQQLAEKLQEQWKSMQDVAQTPQVTTARQPQYGKPLAASLNYRSSMPNLLQETSLGQRRRLPPPPVPPAKPLRLLDQRQRDVTIRYARPVSRLMDLA
jgi:F-box protein 20